MAHGREGEGGDGGAKNGIPEPEVYIHCTVYIYIFMQLPSPPTQTSECMEKSKISPPQKFSHFSNV